MPKEYTNRGRFLRWDIMGHYKFSAYRIYSNLVSRCQCNVKGKDTEQFVKLGHIWKWTYPNLIIIGAVESSSWRRYPCCLLPWAILGPFLGLFFLNNFHIPRLPSPRCSQGLHGSSFFGNFSPVTWLLIRLWQSWPSTPFWTLFVGLPGCHIPWYSSCPPNYPSSNSLLHLSLFLDL